MHLIFNHHLFLCRVGTFCPPLTKVQRWAKKLAHPTFFLYMLALALHITIQTEPA
jgi:hypothetical protein